MESKVRKRKRRAPLQEAAERQVQNDQEEELDVSSDDAESEEDGSSSDGDDDEENSSSSEELTVEFAGHPPSEDDFHGIKRLLQQLFLKSDVDVSGISDVIIGQPEVSVCLTIEESDEDDVYGVLSPINLGQIKEKSCGKQLFKLLLDKASSHSSSANQQLKKILEQPEAACLLINERMVNVPAAIAAPLHEALQRDLEQAVKKKQLCKYATFIVLCKSFQMELPSAGKKKHKKQVASSSINTGDLHYVNMEDELFAKNCNFSFSFRVQDSDTSSDVTALRSVFVLTHKQMRQAWKEVVEMLA